MYQRTKLTIDKQVQLLKIVLDKITIFDSNEDKIDYILDVCNEYKKLLIDYEKTKPN